MPLHVLQTKNDLKTFNFQKLFKEGLGWDNVSGPLAVTVDGQGWTLTPMAQKRGLVAYTCPPLPTGQIPPYALRRKIERQVAKTVREHIIVYTDGTHTHQIW